MSRSDVLVDADWVEAHIGEPGFVIVEVDEDTSAYDKGHIPTAKNVPWSKAANEDGTFKSDNDLTKLYKDEAGVDFGKDTIAYCRIGERSAHTWFVLHEILGQPNVKNYDGSWTEYGSLVGVPIELGDAR